MSDSPSSSKTPALKAEFVKLVLLFFSLFVMLKIVLYRESFAVLFLTLLRFFYVTIIPGLVVSFCLRDRLSFVFRLVLGSVFALAFTGIASYYLGIFGVHVKYHVYIIPPFLMLLGLLLSRKK